MRLLRTLIVIAACLCLAAPALAEKRVALVIGNGAYKHAPALANPKNDAEGMATALKRLKFDVLAGTDLDKPAMEKLLQAFAQKLDTADVALVFYAGHGLQVHGRNYLVPVDGKLDREADLVFQAVPLDVIQGLMEQSQRTNIMILDACRDNPLARNLARTMGTRSTSIGRGLGETKAGIGTLIVYATQPGNVALDGEGKNSPFTLSLLKHIEAPGLEIRQVLTRVRNEVITATRDKQVPWDSSSLRGDFFFAAAPGATPAAPTPVAPPSVTPPPAVPDNEALFWQSIKDSKNAVDYKDYLARWPSGTFAELAKRRIAELEKAADVTPPATAPEKPAPQPAAPQKLQRTSTFERRTVVEGELLRSGGKDTTAEECQRQCLQRERCVGWRHHADVKGCYEFWKITRRSTKGHGDHITSGVIRTMPAAAPVQPGAPKSPTATPSAPAPQTGDALVRELMRKAQAREGENGFCARTNWPAYADSQQDTVVVGTMRRYTAVGPWCTVARTVAVMTENGRRCVREDRWACLARGSCFFETAKFCRNEKGQYQYVRE